MYAFYFEFMARSYTGILEKKKIYLGSYKSEFKFRPKSLLFVNAASSYELADGLNCEKLDNIVDITDVSEERFKSLNLSLLKSMYGDDYIEVEGASVINIAMGTSAIDYAYNTHLFLYLREKYRHDSVQMYGLLRKVMMQLNYAIGNEINIFELRYNEVADYCAGVMSVEDVAKFKGGYSLWARAEKARELRFNAKVCGKNFLKFRDIGFLGRKELDSIDDISIEDKKVTQEQSAKAYEAVKRALKDGGNYKVIPNSSVVESLIYAGEGSGYNCLSGDLVSGNLVATDSIKGQLLILGDDEGKEVLVARLMQGEGNYIVYAKAMTPELIIACMKSYEGAEGKPVKVVGVCTYYGSMLSHPAVLAREKSFPYFVKVS